MGCLLPGLEPYPTLTSQEKRFNMAGWDSARASYMLTVFQVLSTWHDWFLSGYGLRPTHDIVFLGVFLATKHDHV